MTRISNAIQRLLPITELRAQVVATVKIEISKSFMLCCVKEFMMLYRIEKLALEYSDLLKKYLNI